MTKSQKTKNEQQKDLCITSEQLIEQWKKGELPSGWYWVELKKGSFADGKKSIILDYLFEFTNDFERHPYLVESLLAEVPSYEKWKAVHEQWAVLLEENTNKLKELISEFAEANQSLRKQLDEEKAKNRIDYYNGSPMDFLDECERDRKKNKIYKNWINNIRDELIISDLRRTNEGNKFIVNLLAKINQVLGEE